ncbi:MAG: TIM barrel protein [Spirochaeta sp.]|nr:TIM barrel protein [Spirochaeta sp.]
MYIGAHMSAAGGVDKALERGKSIEIDVVQLFTKNQRQWASLPLKAENVDSFRSQASSFYSIFSHTSYLINLASPQNELYKKSITSMADELKRALELGIKMVVLHPGAHVGSGISQGIERIATGIISSYELAGVEASAMEVIDFL